MQRILTEYRMVVKEILNSPASVWSFSEGMCGADENGRPLASAFVFAWVVRFPQWEPNASAPRALRSELNQTSRDILDLSGAALAPCLPHPRLNPRRDSSFVDFNTSSHFRAPG